VSSGNVTDEMIQAYIDEQEREPVAAISMITILYLGPNILGDWEPLIRLSMSILVGASVYLGVFVLFFKTELMALQAVLPKPQV